MTTQPTSAASVGWVLLLTCERAPARLSTKLVVG